MTKPLPDRARAIVARLNARIPCARPARFGKLLPGDGPEDGAARLTKRLGMVDVADLTELTREELEDTLLQYIVAHEYAHLRYWDQAQPYSHMHDAHFWIELGKVTAALEAGD